MTVTPRGEETIAYGGQNLRANRYDLSVQGRDISLWYGLEDQRWLALQTPAKGGRMLRYEPISLPPLTLVNNAEQVSDL